MRRSRPTPSATADDVGAGRLADVRDLVDEADPRHQGRVRGELDHLGRGDVGAHDRRVDPAVQLLDGVAVGVLEGADHDPVGMLEVPDRRALGGELGVRDVADPVEAALVEPVAHARAGADRERCSSSTSTARFSSPASSSTTVQTAERSASPEYVGGVPTAT